MAIVVGDIHGCVEKVRAFLAYKPEEQHIALGDYLDSFVEPQERQIEALQLLLASDAVLLWGNHDLNYLQTPPWQCSGYQWHTHEPLVEIIEANKHHFLAAYAVDGWLCSHAGVHIQVAKHLTDAEAIADMLNKKMAAYLERPTKFLLSNKTLPCPSMFNISIVRGGDHRTGGIFWFDFRRETGLAPVKQVFGHTETSEPVVTESYVALDTTGNKQFCWLFDTFLNELVQLKIAPHMHEEIIDGMRYKVVGNRKPLDNHVGRISDLPEDEQNPFLKVHRKKLLNLRREVKSLLGRPKKENAWFAEYNFNPDDLYNMNENELYDKIEVFKGLIKRLEDSKVKLEMVEDD